jgi:hypothetical protein
MGNPQTAGGQSVSPAAQLRENLVTYFQVSDLETLCYDLGVDYSGLPGDGEAAKVVALLEYFGHNGRIVELIDHCAQARPNVAWDELRRAAVAHPEQFRPTVPAPASVSAGNTAILNVPPDRALKIGIAVGVLAVLLLLCGFSGGLVASKFVAVSLNPVPFSPEAAGSAMGELAKLDTLPTGQLAQVRFNNVAATSLATVLLINPDSPISEVHVQFLAGGDIALNTRLKALGNRRVVLGFGLRAENGRLIVVPKATTLDVLGLQGTTFGWVPIPNASVSYFYTWLQGLLDRVTARFWFQSISIGPNSLSVTVFKR